jgi:hypothetical protein
MTKSEEKAYRDVCANMTDRTMMLASQVAADAVKRGVPYRLACHAVKVALYQGFFGSVLRNMKNDGLAASDLKMEAAFVSAEEHERVAHEIVKLIFDHLQVVDRRYIWSMNIAKRKAKPGEIIH